MCAAPGGAANTANCSFVNADLTAVGSYAGSPSPSGSFDQGGNVWEWSEGLVGVGARIQGGVFDGGPHLLDASTKIHVSGDSGNSGFRLASIPEPATGMLLLAGVCGLAGWRRRRV